MQLTPLGVSMVGSWIGVLFGITASGAFLLGDIGLSSTARETDLVTVRIGAICSLLIAGGGVITAVGGQILGAYKLYLQQRETDQRQDVRHEEIVRRLISSVDVTKNLEEQLASRERHASSTIAEMEKQIVVIQGMLDRMTKDLKETVIEQATGTKEEIKDVISKEEIKNV